VPPGRYTLHVRLTGDDTPLVSVEGVDIGRGTVEDPRLWSLDIRGKVRLARIRLVDADGRPVMSGGRLRVRDSDAHGWNSLDFRNGELLLGIASRPIAATLHVPGRRDVELEGIDGDRDVVLPAPLEVRVELVPELGLPHDVRLHAFLQPQGKGPDPISAIVRGQRGPIFGSGQPAVERPGP